MNAEMDVGTNKKAFQINLDQKKYGTFAEIGAGQEVARRFFHVGGASGTVAKTMSAYDMTFSDAIYGTADRYVSRNRLQTMLDHEYDLLVERLDAKFGNQRTFFVFADTVAGAEFQAAQRIARLAWRAFPERDAERAEPDHHPRADARRNERRPAGGARRGRREPALRRVLLSPAGEADRLTAREPRREPDAGRHDQVFRAGVCGRR
jgi:hypothetical protein